MSVNQYLLDRRNRGEKGVFILIDPDKGNPDTMAIKALIAQGSGAAGVLVGGSLLNRDDFENVIARLQEELEIPVIIFPGGSSQISANADAIFFLSLISGRNPQYLISEHVTAAPLVKKMGLEVIPIGYMLIESGNVSAVEYISDTKPIPRNQVSIAAAHAIAGEMLGMKMIYLEAGSGAKHPVPPEMITAVAKSIDIPLIVGGGIRNAKDAKKAARAGADFIVIGNALEDTKNQSLLKDIVAAIS